MVYRIKQERWCKTNQQERGRRTLQQYRRENALATASRRTTS